MDQIGLEEIVEHLPLLSPEELRFLKLQVDSLVNPLLSPGELRSVKLQVDNLLRFVEKSELSTDLAAGLGRRREEEGSGLADAARALLEGGVEDGRWTLADQALLASVILSDSYQQGTFSSRDLNDVIEECGQPRVANITSALSRLLERGYLEGATKDLRLSKEGKAKARGLVAMLSRGGEAA